MDLVASFIFLSELIWLKDNTCNERIKYLFMKMKIFSLTQFDQQPFHWRLVYHHGILACKPSHNPEIRALIFGIVNQTKWHSLLISGMFKFQKKNLLKLTKLIFSKPLGFICLRCQTLSAEASCFFLFHFVF